MNIPLNIDWQQILLHLLNFAILAFGLYFLLYKPVKKFMDQRAAHYRDMDAEAREKLDRAAAMEEDYQARIASAEAEIMQMKAKAAKETEETAGRQLQQARAQAEKILSDARVNAEAERGKIIADAQTEIMELASLAAEKLVQDSLERAYDEFLEAAEGGAVHGE